VQRERRESKLILLFAITYFASYVTRINYGAVISEMIRATGYSKPLLSMAVTGSFVTYGAGQLISGACGDRFSPKKLVELGLSVSSLMNILIPLCGSPYQMAAVWCVNGMAQAFIWPPLVKIMSSMLSEEGYRTGVVRVSWGSSLGTVAVYLVSPLLISLCGWRAVFVAAAICGVAVVWVWNRRAADTAPNEAAHVQNRSFHGLLAPYILCILFAIVMMGMLRDGVTTWMPSYISETYHLGSAVSILSGVVMPVFSILSCQIALKVYARLRSILLCAIVFFGVGGLSAAAMSLLSGKQALVSVLFAALLTGSMHGVNLMLVSMIPQRFKKFGNVSLVSGVLNSCTYVGSAISTYGVAIVSEGYGWSIALFLWILMAVLGLAACVVSLPGWNRNMEIEEGSYAGKVD